MPLLSAVDGVGKVVAGDRRLLKRRVKQISEGEWAGVAVRQAVDAVVAATTATWIALTAATTADPTTSSG